MATCRVQDAKGWCRHLVAKLDSAAKDCLDTNKGDASYIWQYSHSLNGRHYIFSQSLPLELFGILTNDDDKITCQLMLSIASLGAHLWFPVIKNLDKYIVCHKADLQFQCYSAYHATQN